MHSAKQGVKLAVRGYRCRAEASWKSRELCLVWSPCSIGSGLSLEQTLDAKCHVRRVSFPGPAEASQIETASFWRLFKNLIDILGIACIPGGRYDSQTELLRFGDPRASNRIQHLRSRAVRPWTIGLPPPQMN